MNFFNFFYVSENTDFEKNRSYNCATISLIRRKILVGDMEFCERNISKLRNVTFTLKNFRKLKNKIDKIHTDSKKLINSCI